jgi:hypothetical protein
VNLEAVDVEAEAFPEPEPPHLGIEVELEHTIIIDALLEAAPVAEGLPV